MRRSPVLLRASERLFLEADELAERRCQLVLDFERERAAEGDAGGGNEGGGVSEGGAGGEWAARLAVVV